MEWINTEKEKPNSKQDVEIKYFAYGVWITALASYHRSLGFRLEGNGKFVYADFWKPLIFELEFDTENNFKIVKK